jgi:hypothetical protein
MALLIQQDNSGVKKSNVRMDPSAKKTCQEPNEVVIIVISGGKKKSNVRMMDPSSKKDLTRAK